MRARDNILYTSVHFHKPPKNWKNSKKKKSEQIYDPSQSTTLNFAYKSMRNKAQIFYNKCLFSFSFDWWIAFDYPLFLQEYIYIYNDYVNSHENKIKEQNRMKRKLLYKKTIVMKVLFSLSFYILVHILHARTANIQFLFFQLFQSVC